jgi:hypothetical protein
MTSPADDWSVIRRTVRRSVQSSLHCAVTSVNPDGSAHVTPIGSLVLTGIGQGYYFDVFNRELSRNLDRDPRVTILAVNSGKRLWLESLLRGRFVSLPGVRLVATVGSPRPATEEEIQRWRRSISPALRTPGGRAMWGFTSARARDILVAAIAPVTLGSMTKRLGTPETFAPR